MTTTDGPKKTSGLKLGLIGCCGCLVAMIAFLGLVVGIPLMATGPAVEVARGHLKGAAADPAKAYAACSSTFKAATSEASFRAFVASHPELYGAADLTFSSRSFRNGVVRLRGHTTSATGVTTPIELQLIEEGGAWRVTWVGSPDGEDQVEAPATEAPAPATEAPATEARVTDRPPG